MDNDFYSCCIDEIALEGLDGITLQALWIRLQRRPNFGLCLDERSKEFIWQSLIPEPRLSFYRLKTPRMDLVIYDRYQHVDPITGYVVEPAVLPPDTYPVQVVNKNGQLGSCTTFDTRKDISEEIRERAPKLDEAVATWGNELVIVADQTTRELALLGPYNSTKDMDISEIKYCILERIGRSRFMGQTTQGTLDLRVFNVSHANMFVIRKQLLQRNLITKQDYYEKGENKTSKTGFLLHLPRFFVEVKTKSKVLTKELCALLATKPQQREVYAKLYTELGLRPIVFKKLMNSPSTSQYVTQYTLPYNEYYADSPPDTWYHKNNQLRAVRIVELAKPYVEDDVEEDFEGFFADNDSGLYFHPHKYIYDRPRLDQAYKEVYKAGTAGMTLRELAVALMTTRLEVRNLQKGLITKKLVVPYRVDVGKQRVIRYFCPEFAVTSEVHLKLAAEKKRMLESKNKLPPAKKQRTMTPEVAEAVEGTAKDTANGSETEAAASAPVAGTVETAQNVENEKVVAAKRVATTPLGGARKRLRTGKAAADNPSVSTSAGTDSAGVPSPDADGAGADQPIITVETNSDCHFRKVSPTTKIVFPSALGMTGREPLQRLLPSYKMLRRANQIIEFVQSERLISDLSKLIKALQKTEEEEGATTKLDRVSIERLIYKLCKGGYLKSIRTVLQLGPKVVDLKWVCHPSVSKDDEIVRATIEQAKFKYFATQKDKPEPAPKPEPALKPDLDVCKMVYSPSIGRFYGSQPKFRRMHLCYVFMHYLLYTYDGVPQEPSPDDPSAPVQYHTALGWKMFVPPLTKSPTTPEGWVLFGDILLSLPLSLFVKVVSCIRHKIEGLEEYLNDDVKRHYLVRFLPVKMRNALLFARRYIYSIHDTIKRLAFFGMLTFGPQRLKEKDQVFVFLHRKLRIKDTTASSPGYHQVSANIEYPCKYFFLETEDDVNQFWLELENICLCTPLGMPQTMQGQSIELQNLYKKPSMIESCRNREFGEEKDDGSVPGDQLGAGGFDSALFAHLKRNWSYQTSISSKPTASASEKAVSKDPKPIQKFLNYLDKASKETGGSLPQKQKQRLSRLHGTISRLSACNAKEPDNKEPEAAANGVEKAASQQPKKRKFNTKKSQSVIRVIKPRKRHVVRRPYYDDKDQAALKQMKTMRVVWSLQEDIVLLMCKVTSWFLDPHLDKMVVPFTVIRDILNERYPELSRDKTSRACQRRLRFMLTNPATKANASVFLCEAQQDQMLVEMFHGPKPVKSDEAQWKSMFRTVLDHLMIKFSKSSEERHLDITLPRTLDELKSCYDVVVSGQVEPDSWSYSEPHNLVDIHFSSVAMVILASLAADDGKTSWSLILYKIYEQYPDKLVRSVTARLRHNGVICRKLAHSKKLFISLNLSMLPFALSKRFRFEMTRRYSPLHVGTMAKFLLELLAKFRSGEPFVAQDSIEPAYAPLLISLQLMGKLTLAIEVPDGIVDFDSSIANTGLLPQRRTLPASAVDKLFPAAATLSDRARSLNFETAGGNAKTSRSFLYMLRQHMTKVLEYNSLRPQDYVVIKSCKLEFALTDEDLVPGWSPEEPTDKSYSLKVRHPTYDAIVQEQRTCHSASIVDTSWKPEDVLRVYGEEGRTADAAQAGTEIYYFILKKEHLGVSHADLCEAFHPEVDISALEAHLDLLLRKRLILQVGVKCIRYVTARHCKPWVIRSFKIPKDMRCFASLSEQEQKLTAGSRNVAGPEQTTASGDSEPVGKAQTPVATGGGDGTAAEDGPDLACPSTSSSCVDNKDSDSHVDADDGARIGERAPSTRRLREGSKMKRTFYESMTKNINLENLEQLMYVPRLWRKPDGSLNRPVFHQMLAAVLSYILDNPGVTEDRFRTDFSHQIEPCVQTLDVLKILEQLGCVRRFFMRLDTTAKCTLFSRRRELFVCDEYCPGDTVCYKGTPEALVNFAAFTAYFTK